MSLVNYLKSLEEALCNEWGDTLAEALSVTSDQATAVIPQIQENRLDAQCNKHLTEIHNEIAAAHLRAVMYHAQGNTVDAYESQVALLSAYLRVFEEATGSSLPVLFTIMSDVKFLALEADAVLVEQGQAASKLIDATQVLRKCLSASIKDRSPQNSRRSGTLRVVNILLSIYFKTSKLHLCSQVIGTVAHTFDDLDRFPISDVVTYKFYTGSLAMFDNEFSHAHDLLSFAFENCTSASPNNKRLILINLIPLRLMKGMSPTDALLQKYNLPQYRDLTVAVKQGNIELFNRVVAQHQAFFISYRVYLAIEQLSTIIYRNLFRRIYLIAGSHQLKISAFVDVLTSFSEDVDTDEVECLIANLIYKGYMKGYIAHKHNILVLSKKEAFPPISSGRF